jgi:hypothetical protein
MIRSTIPPISIKDTTISHIKPLKRTKHTTYGIKYQGPCLGQTQKYGMFKMINGILF